jgi:glycerophosphoryl diester phosphodiesterase
MAVVIAHRGASGYLPEHTLEGKALAYGLGADFLEQDVVATRDSELVVLHDAYLDDTTDVAIRFADRRRSDGHFYVIDFGLRELKSLRVMERRRHGTAEPVYADRFPSGVGSFRINTLDEELDLIRGLNRSMRRNVGIYPEIKDPQWHLQHGIDLSRLVLEKLADHGYRSVDDAAFVQCFDPVELRRVRAELGCRLKLVQLVGSEPEYAQLLDAPGLQRVAEYATGLGPSYSQLVVVGSDGAPAPTELTANAHAAGLAVHAYTFRRDALPPYAATLEQLIELFVYRIGIDGLFCDHPDVAVRVRDALSGHEAR